ncbi:hypothetical protein G6F32_015164 [Rhizopus arrhizus]|nr:hypothetical protein G6F32_015164 [Rhizopus arrhizus]
MYCGILGPERPPGLPEGALRTAARRAVYGRQFAGRQPEGGRRPRRRRATPAGATRPLRRLCDSRQPRVLRGIPALAAGIRVPGPAPVAERPRDADAGWPAPGAGRRHRPDGGRLRPALA